MFHPGQTHAHPEFRIFSSTAELQESLVGFPVGLSPRPTKISKKKKTPRVIKFKQSVARFPGHLFRVYFVGFTFFSSFSESAPQTGHYWNFIFTFYDNWWSAIISWIQYTKITSSGLKTMIFDLCLSRARYTEKLFATTFGRVCFQFCRNYQILVTALPYGFSVNRTISVIERIIRRQGRIQGRTRGQGAQLLEGH